MSRRFERPHRRYNPLLDEWVLSSPHRLQRPWQGQIEDTPAPTRPAYDPSCYLCPGNLRANGQPNPAYGQTYCFDNDFPALLTESDVPDGNQGGLLIARPATGRCRVLCFSPRHDLTLARMPAQEVRSVVDAWAEETSRLGSHRRVLYVQAFENKGALMGNSNPHPHGQLWATDHIPTIPARKLASLQRHFDACGRDLLGDYLERELTVSERIVFRNDHWVALVPFWAVWPFETMLLPLRRVPDLPALAPAERDALADAIQRLCVRYDNLFRSSFPYSMGFHGRPCDGDEHPAWRLHAVYLPPLLRSASVRKFLVGYELTAEAQRDLSPEDAAERWRVQSEIHFESN